MLINDLFIQFGCDSVLKQVGEVVIQGIFIANVDEYKYLISVHPLMEQYIVLLLHIVFVALLVFPALNR